ncbi:hypothetical protein ACFS5M_07410 [Lacinutrix iliipiscaria]|uniref:Secreted protein n=1 Tax=Lacinutrix iliipiscaria TaxID=1230532 RepID=A0ABW5WNM3_9FLAO
MKKLVLVIVVFMGSFGIIKAQEIAPNAIGLRLGDSEGFGASVSYQRAILEHNRLEFDLGWRNGRNLRGVKGVALFQWIKPLVNDFNWYFGAGGGLSSVTIDIRGTNDNVTDTFGFIAGDIGVEYHFDFPLLLSLDIRPELGFGDDVYDNDNLDFDVGVGVRYTF